MIDDEKALYYLKKIHDINLCESDFVTDKTKHGIGLAMMYLYHNKDKDVTAGDLAKKLDCSSARIAVLIKKLEEKNFIIKKKSESDQRVTIVSLTDTGEEFITKIFEHSILEMKNYVNYIGSEKMEYLIGILDDTKKYFIKRRDERNV